MLEDVHDEDIVTFQVDRFENLREELTRLADERLSLRVLVRPRRLADDHEVRIRVARTRHRVQGRRIEGASRALRDRRSNRFEALERCDEILQRTRLATNHETPWCIDHLRGWGLWKRHPRGARRRWWFRDRRCANGGPRFRSAPRGTYGRPPIGGDRGIRLLCGLSGAEQSHGVLDGQ